MNETALKKEPHPSTRYRTKIALTWGIAYGAVWSLAPGFLSELLRNVGEPVAGGEDYVVYRTADGLEFVNGPGKFSSREIYDCKHKPLLTDEVVQGIKELVPLAQLINTRTVFDDMPSDDPDALPAKPASAKVKKERTAIKRSVDQLQENEVPW